MNNLIICDTREKGNKKILEYFEKVNQDYIISKLDAGDYIYVRNKNDTLSISESNYVVFAMTGNIEASGNVMSLLNFIEDVPSYAFYSLFSSCTALTKAPELPAKKIGISGYESMFQWCTGLTEAPYLPATHVSTESYALMFADCSNLEKGPYIKAVIFVGSSPFSAMFEMCTNLNYIKMDYAANFSFLNWVNGVTAYGTLYYNGYTTTRGPDTIPINFTVVPFTD